MSSFYSIPGPAGTIQIGTVTTGPAGSNVAVTNTGTAEAAILNFTIPRGDTGTISSAAQVPAFGWQQTDDNYGLYIPGTAIRAGDLGEANLDVQSRLRRCVLSDAGVVQYYLDADDSTKKAGDWLRVVETQSLDTAYTGTTQEATNSILRTGVPAWAAGTFTQGQRVTHNGSLWECLAASTTAAPAAGTVASDLTGTDGQVMVEVPAFSVRHSFAGGVHTREVRLGCGDGLTAQGFLPHPAFVKTDGTFKAAFYLGAYQAYNAGGNILGSVSGQNNVVSITRGTARSLAVARGIGWHQQSYYEIAAIQTLLVCEHQDHNSQKVVGNGAQEGGAFVVATGLSNGRGNRNGNAYTAGGANTDYMSYRGIENLYGRAWQWVDGFNVYERVVYLTNNQSAFADNTSVGYKVYAQVPSGSSSYQKAIQPFPDVFLPSSVAGGSSTSYLADGLWTSSGWRVALVGGDSGNGALVGAFALSLSVNSGAANAGIGARAAYAQN